MGSRTQINHDDFNKLKYCSSLIKETLRFNPPFPSILRNTNSEFTATGFKIPTNTNLWAYDYDIFLNYMIHHKFFFFNLKYIAEFLCVWSNGI